MIPKVIHYCWFGENPLSDLAKKCIESWRKFLPDYEIKEWNESNYDVESCDYISEAYKSKKWAFVSDYARFDILYKYGGLYFDTDVELIRPLDDIINEGPFMGTEISSEDDMGIAVNPGLGLAAEAKMQFYKEILDYYNTQHFIKEDGSMNFITIVARTTNLLKEHGLDIPLKIQKVAEINIYPTSFFGPMNYATGELNIKNETKSIHHYTASWHTKEEIKIIKLQQKTSLYFGYKIGFIVERIYSFPYRLKTRIYKYGFKNTILFIIKKLILR